MWQNAQPPARQLQFAVSVWSAKGACSPNHSLPLITYVRKYCMEACKCGFVQAAIAGAPSRTRVLGSSKIAVASVFAGVRRASWVRRYAQDGHEGLGVKSPPDCRLFVSFLKTTLCMWREEVYVWIRNWAVQKCTSCRTQWLQAEVERPVCPSATYRHDEPPSVCMAMMQMPNTHCPCLAAELTHPIARMCSLQLAKSCKPARCYTRPRVHICLV